MEMARKTHFVFLVFVCFVEMVERAEELRLAFSNITKEMRREKEKKCEVATRVLIFVSGSNCKGGAMTFGLM